MHNTFSLLPVIIKLTLTDFRSVIIKGQEQLGNFITGH